MLLAASKLFSVLQQPAREGSALFFHHKIMPHSGRNAPGSLWGVCVGCQKEAGIAGVAVVAPDGFGVKQESSGVWGGICCSSHISCSPGTSNQCLARKVTFSRGGIAVAWGCPSGFLSPSAQWGP